MYCSTITNVLGIEIIPILFLRRVFVPYWASFTRRATLASSVTGPILIGFNTKHAQFKWKSDIFGLQIGFFLVQLFPDGWSTGTKTLHEYEV